MNLDHPHSIPDVFQALLAVEPEQRQDELVRRFGQDPALVAEVAAPPTGLPGKMSPLSGFVRVPFSPMTSGLRFP